MTATPSAGGRRSSCGSARSTGPPTNASCPHPPRRRAAPAQPQLCRDGRRATCRRRHWCRHREDRANPAWHDLNTLYLHELTAVGFPPEVDLVVLTHLHTDHVGWNTRREDDDWVPTFPNARYVTSDAEWAYWCSAELGDDRVRMSDDSILPIRDAGLLDTVDVGAQGCEIAPGLAYYPRPATPGMAAPHRRQRRPRSAPPPRDDQNGAVAQVVG